MAWTRQGGARPATSSRKRRAEPGGGLRGSGQGRFMKAWAASVEEVFREAAARWTLIAYFALSTLFILIFALAVNLDVVNGALAGANLFGQSLDLGGRTIDIDR